MLPPPSADPSPPITSDDKRVLLRVARATLEATLGRGTPTEPVAGSPALDAIRATFVTLTQRDSGELRGCRGEIRAVRSLAASVAKMAVASATTDPRFPAVTGEELDDLHIEISALTPMRRIRPDEVVVGRDGLFLVRGGFSGLLLPQVPVEQGWNRDTFLGWTCRKAGLPEDAWRDPETELFAFEAEVWGEDE